MNPEQRSKKVTRVSFQIAAKVWPLLRILTPSWATLFTRLE